MAGYFKKTNKKVLGCSVVFLIRGAHVVEKAELPHLLKCLSN